VSSNDDRLGAELDQLTAAIRDRDGTEATRIVNTEAGPGVPGNTPAEGGR